MGIYVEALGFVVAAIVFSIGVLSARLHESFNALVRQIVELSWATRVRLMEGRRVSPADIDELTAAVGDVADPVAGASKALNRLLLLVSAAIFAMALATPADAADPPHSRLLIGLLFATCVGVELLGELDQRAVGRRRRALVTTATLSRLRSLGQAFTEERYADASEALAALRDDFPGWGLLRELNALLDLHTGAPGSALKSIRALVAEPHPDLYLSQLIAVEAATSELDDRAALELLDDIARAEPSLPHLGRLRKALEIRLGHLDALLAPMPAPSGKREEALLWTEATIGSAAEQQADRAMSGLDVSPGSLPEVGRLLSVTVAWTGARTHLASDALTASSPLHLVLRRVLPDEAPSAFGPRDGDPRWDSATLETFGVIALSQGEPRQALSLLEHAARQNPAAARPQWWIAVACRHLNWTDAAHRALDRSEILDREDPLTDLTRAWLTAEPADDEGAWLAKLSDVDGLRAAFLGHAPIATATPGNLRDHLLAELPDPRPAVGSRAGPDGGPWLTSSAACSETSPGRTPAWWSAGRSVAGRGSPTISRRPVAAAS